MSAKSVFVIVTFTSLTGKLSSTNFNSSYEGSIFAFIAGLRPTNILSASFALIAWSTPTNILSASFGVSIFPLCPNSYFETPLGRFEPTRKISPFRFGSTESPIALIAAIASDPFLFKEENASSIISVKLLAIFQTFKSFFNFSD